MRIAFVTPSLSMGGYEKVIIAYANELNKRGHQVDILCGFKKGDLIDTIENGITIYDFQSRARNFIFPLIKYLKKNKVDILYCGFRSYSSIGVLANKIAGADACVYATQHGFQKDGKIERLMRGAIIKRAGRLTAVTQTVAEFESKEMKIPITQFHILDNPVYDKSKSVRLEDHDWFRESIPIVVVCGRIATDKGKNFCIQILCEMNKKIPVRMLLLGDGPERETCENLARSLDVYDKTDFLGYVDNPLGYIAQCDLLLHTAWEEAFGNIIVEALAVNKPVCLTNCTGPMSIIKNGEYGVTLGMPSDENFISTASEKVLDVLSGKIQFGNLQERAAKFDVQCATDMFLDLFKKEEERK